MGKTTDILRSLCQPSTTPSGSIEASEPAYSSISSLQTDDDNNTPHKLLNDDDSKRGYDKDNLLC